MRKKSIGLLLAICLMLSLVGCTTQKEETNVLSNMVSNYLSSVQESYAYDVAYTLAYDESYLSNTLGFRTAGSDAEHAASDYIATQMKNIGLEVEKVPVTVDKWQFNDASLTIADTDIHITPASYATNGTSADGICAEIVDVGTGTSYEYDGLDVQDKIVLVGVDQWNEAWIDQYMNEAKQHGASAIVSYDVGGYATYSDDMINMQDVCTYDVLPSVSISKNQYLEIRQALDNGHNQATLVVDNVMLEGEGISYNVVGKLKGKSSEQQIIVSGHYDVYFNGFQDDSCAIGLVLAMAKGLIASNYQPENDILFIAHGSEEWGASASQYDWTTGAWEMIYHAHPEWTSKTIAMINFELPAFYDGQQQAYISCVPEYASLVKYFVKESGLVGTTTNNIYPDGVSEISVDTNTMEDGVSYRFAGVPYFINIPGTQDGEDGWIQQRYHTKADDQDTYSADVMSTNLNVFGTLAIYLDQAPAMQLDFTATCDDLAEASIQDESYDAAVEQLREIATLHNEKVNKINTEYFEALEKHDTAKMETLRQEGKELNQTSLKVFKMIQDDLMGLILTSDVVIKHINYINNIDILEGVIAALERGELGNEEETGALDLAWMINGGSEYGYYCFSLETNSISQKGLFGELLPNNQFWGTDKTAIFAQTYPATTSLLEKAETGNTDFTYELSIYRAELQKQIDCLSQAITEETNAIHKIIETFE